LTTWNAELSAGATRSQVVHDIQDSPSNEFRNDEVQALYRQFLHRAADPTGLNNAVAFLRSGGTVEQLAVVLVASAEYNQRTNGSNDGWLDTIYQDALHRAVDAMGRVGWDAAFAAGASRAQVASAIFASDEYRGDLIQGYYQQYLDRPAETAGENAWLAFFRQGGRDEAVIAGIIGSAEFFNKTAS
jgi:hypothetical protein